MPTSIKIKKEDAQELICLGDIAVADWPSLGYKLQLVHAELVGQRRWSNDYEAVFKDVETGKFYQTSYSSGATERQDESPYEYDGDEIEFVEVVPVEVKTIKYEVAN
ncbi:hypothetical protein D3C77_37990 [compost metagenome]